LQHGFHASKIDTSLFFYNKRDVVMFLHVYVDDIIVVSSSKEGVPSLLEDLRPRIALKDLWPLHYILGVEIKIVNDEYNSHKASMCPIFSSKLG
jgi:hypothetical protein